MPTNFLTAVRINRAMQAIQDKRDLPASLVWVPRIPPIKALDDELFLRWIGRAHIADLVADDQSAITYSTGTAKFESYTAPNIKHGAQMTQAMVRQMRALQAVGTLSGDGGIFLQRENTLLDQLRLGVLQRMETIDIGMLMDAFSYNRMGITVQNASWNMPADLKITVGTAWTDATNATPVTDLWNLLRLAWVRYGVKFDRMTMSRACFDLMIATVEFQAKAKLLLPFGLTFANLITQATEQQVAFAQRIIGIPTIELYDQRYWQQDGRGVETAGNYHPINKVILTVTQNDGDLSVWDWANGEVMEPVIANMLGSGLFAGMTGQTYGPISYVTGAVDLNPPNATYWTVARGWARKHLLQASAVLTVGTFTDPIPYGAPF